MSSLKDHQIASEARRERETEASITLLPEGSPAPQEAVEANLNDDTPFASLQPAAGTAPGVD